MQIPQNSSQQSHEVESHGEEQTFSQWARKRLELYQSIEQQTQSSIAQTLQLAADFTSRMEEDANRILSRYHHERAELQSQVDNLQREINELQDTMERERQEQKARLAIEQQQMTRTLEKQQNAAMSTREKLLRDAYAERDRVVSETQQLSAHLADLQHALQGILGGSRSTTTSLLSAHSTAQTEVEDAEEAEAVEEAEATEDAEAVEEHEPGILLIIEEVDSFILASEVMDRFEQNEAIDEVTLVQYEQNTLRLAVQHIEGESIDRIVDDIFGSALEVVERDQHTIRLIYRGNG